MIKALYRIDASGTDPDENLALEEYLLTHAREGECLLYLWQNQRTVVIGRNQNSWKECQVRLLEVEGGHLARRLSGGGAVFHDLGNLNFTFITRKEDYDVGRQTQVILRAVRLLRIQAEATGRNDITVEGKKFSGNAFYQSGDCCFHHGTLLLSADTKAMSRYLTVSKEKLRSKSVESVRGRVTNLGCYVEGITPEMMKEKMAEAFSQVYGLPVEAYPAQRLNQARLGELAQKYGSWEWKYGRRIPFSDQGEDRFTWGEAQVQLEVDQGRVTRARIWSDALDASLIQQMEDCLPGTLFRPEDLAAAAGQAGQGLEPGFPGQEAMELRRLMAKDIASLLAKMCV